MLSADAIGMAYPAVVTPPADAAVSMPITWLSALYSGPPESPA